ncbi:hypothetical protein ABNX05_22050 [Lysinibacillus sp. M3]|uniref:ABC transporter permease n=1 Tax=Lysinibacillus zambalensis TaxID=3160866 RepID=A0ABV1MXV0_9BACI
MDKDILIPIAIGFFANVVVFGISMLVVKNKRKAAKITLIFLGINVLMSFLIGSWGGLGLLVISFGMLIVSICLYLYIYIERSFKKSV